MIRVLVVDDQALVRGGVCLMLRTAGEDVVGEAQTVTRPCGWRTGCAPT